MAKKKTAVKTPVLKAPILRQALSAVKTAIINFSPAHILFVSYNPASKETVVRDIPENLESQFILGQSAGGNTLSPKLTVTMTVHNDSAVLHNNCLIVPEVILGVTDNHLSVTTDSITINEGETGKATVYSEIMLSDGDYVGMLELTALFTETPTIQSLTYSDAVNCIYQESGGYRLIIIPDIDSDASISFDVVLDSIG